MRIARVAAVDQQATSDLNWRRASERSCEWSLARGDPVGREVILSDDVVRRFNLCEWRDPVRAAKPFASLHQRTVANVPIACWHIRSGNFGRASEVARRSQLSRGSGQQSARATGYSPERGRVYVRGDNGHNCGLNPAEVERVGLYNKHWPPISRFGAAGLRKIRPPDLAAANFAHSTKRLLQAISVGHGAIRDLLSPAAVNTRRSGVP